MENKGIDNRVEDNETNRHGADVNQRSKQDAISWVKNHKNQLIIAGVSVTAVLGVLLGIKNKEYISKLCSVKFLKAGSMDLKIPSDGEISLPSLESVADKVIETRQYTSPSRPILVPAHIRTLPAGKHHSAKKAAQAAALGIELLPNQTFVDPYIKNAA